jgi:precorrin-6B methylase 2
MGNLVAADRIGDTALLETGAIALARKNEARRRTVREQSALGVGNAPLCRADTTAAVEDLALGPDPARI